MRIRRWSVGVCALACVAIVALAARAHARDTPAWQTSAPLLPGMQAPGHEHPKPGDAAAHRGGTSARTSSVWDMVRGGSGVAQYTPAGDEAGGAPRSSDTWQLVAATFRVALHLTLGIGTLAVRAAALAVGVCMSLVRRAWHAPLVTAPRYALQLVKPPVYAACVPIIYVAWFVHTVFVAWPMHALGALAYLVYHLYSIVGVASITGVVLGAVFAVALHAEHAVYAWRLQR